MGVDASAAAMAAVGILHVSGAPSVFAEQWAPPSPYDPKNINNHQKGRTYLISTFHKWLRRNHPADQ